MHALGETEPMTDANYPHRLALVTAYAQAYRQASTQGPAAAASPARIATQGFPRHPGPPGRLPRASPAAGPGTGRRDDRTREDQQQPQGDLMSQWTPEAIRALGVRTDLPTLGKIFGISRARAYQMAHTGEWEQAGIRIVPLGSKYVVAVQSILDVLGHGDAETGAGTGQPGNGQVHSAGTAADDAITGPSGPVAAWNLR